MASPDANGRRDVRPRVVCPGCKRSIAVTFDSREGTAYLRPHNAGTGPRWVGQKCSHSGKSVSREGMH